MDNTLALTVLKTHIDGIKKQGRLDLAGCKSNHKDKVQPSIICGSSIDSFRT